MYCKKPIVVGVDTYDFETKKSYHEECRENQPPGPEDFRLAGELGFVHHDEASIRAAIDSWRVSDGRILRLLSANDRSDSTGRKTAATCRGQNGNLFDEETK